MPSLIDIDAEYCQDPQKAMEKEWLLTNAIGGYSSSTILGCNMRKYHGLLAASLDPPLKRRVIVSSIEEKIIQNGEFYISSSFRNGEYSPRGFERLVNFRLDPFPIFTFALDGLEIEKRVILCQGKNTVLVRYRVIDGDTPAKLMLTPFITCRSIHEVLIKGPAFQPVCSEHEKKQIICTLGEDCPDLFLTTNAYHFTPLKDQHEKVEYPRERERGYQAEDTLLRLCVLEFRISRNQDAYIIAGLDREVRAPVQIEQEELLLYRTISRKAKEIHPEKKDDPSLVHLVKASGAFVVKPKSGTDIIAGYPWFSVWSRDSMISLPGLLLETKRFEDARALLLSFISRYRDGLFPNTIPEEKGEISYNTVDAGLWFIHAVYEYYIRTQDRATVQTPLYHVIKDIIQLYIHGTLFGIRQDSDGLITAGESGFPLTWMDAKIGDRVVTPRIGKNVEVNCLWHHALHIMAFFSDLLDDEQSYAAYEIHAENVKNAFEKAFWNEKDGYLYDIVNSEGADSSLRPNQVFALSLSPPILTEGKAEKVFDRITSHLLTPYGLRSLAPGHPEYKSRYEGDQKARDNAYPQGTVWSWLLGPYIDAMINIKGETPENVKKALKLLQPLLDHMTEAGLGFISEVFDGDAPHTAGGCYAQAFSVAEILRAYLRLLSLKQALDLEKK